MAWHTLQRGNLESENLNQKEHISEEESRAKLEAVINALTKIVARNDGVDPFTLLHHPEWEHYKTYSREAQERMGDVLQNKDITWHGGKVRVFKWGQRYYIDKLHGTNDTAGYNADIEKYAAYLHVKPEQIVMADDLAEYNRLHEQKYNEITDPVPQPLKSSDIVNTPEIKLDHMFEVKKNGKVLGEQASYKEVPQEPIDEYERARNKYNNLANQWGSLLNYVSNREVHGLNRKISGLIKNVRELFEKGKMPRTEQGQAIMKRWGRKDKNGKLVWTASPLEEKTAAGIWANAYSKTQQLIRSRIGDVRTIEQYIRDQEQWYVDYQNKKAAEWEKAQAQKEEIRQAKAGTPEEQEEAKKNLIKGVIKAGHRAGYSMTKEGEFKTDKKGQAIKIKHKEPKKTEDNSENTPKTDTSTNNVSKNKKDKEIVELE